MLNQAQPLNSPEAVAALDTGLACLVILARINQCPVSPDQILHEFGNSEGPLSESSLLLAAKKIGLKAKVARTTIERLDRTPLPAIACNLSGEYFVLGN